MNNPNKKSRVKIKAGVYRTYRNPLGKRLEVVF